MGVNIAALVHYKFRSKEKVLFPVLHAPVGFLVSGFIWLNLNQQGADSGHGMDRHRTFALLHHAACGRGARPASRNRES